MYIFTILSAVVQGVLEPGPIEGPYALDDRQETDTLQPDALLLLAYSLDTDSGRRVTAASKT